MFITCMKKVKFKHLDNPSIVWEMNPGFIGEIPLWVEKSWYFDALCKDGSISAIVSKKDKDIQNSIEYKEDTLTIDNTQHNKKTKVIK